MSQAKALILFGKLCLLLCSCICLYFGFAGSVGYFQDDYTTNGDRALRFICALFALGLVLFFFWYVLQPIKVTDEVPPGHEQWYKRIGTGLASCWQSMKTPAVQHIIQQNPQAARAFNCADIAVRVVDNMVGIADGNPNEPQAPAVRIQPRVNFYPAIDNSRDVGDLHEVAVIHGRNNPFAGGSGNTD